MASATWSANPPDTPEHLKYEERDHESAGALAEDCRRTAKQIFAHNSSEYIQFNEPETVVNAIRDVYDQSKNK